MKKIHFFFFLLLFEFSFHAFATKPFRFALMSDLHISVAKHQPSEDLQRAVSDVNNLTGIDFVIVSGDVSDRGDTVSLRMAKRMLQKLTMPYYIIPGNHDVKWYETGSANFNAVFGKTNFDFTHNDIEFIGFTTAPLNISGLGYIQPEDLNLVKTELEKTGNEKSVFMVTHYPLQTGDVDNWKELTNELKNHNVQAVLGGHYHRNVLLNYSGYPGIVNRSTLRGKEAMGGYSIYSVSDSLRTYEKIIGQPEEKWLTLPLEKR